MTAEPSKEETACCYCCRVEWFESLNPFKREPMPIPIADLRIAVTPDNEKIYVCTKHYAKVRKNAEPEYKEVTS